MSESTHDEPDSPPAAGRFGLPPIGSWTPAQREASALIRARRGKLPLPHTILLHTPAVALQFDALSSTLQASLLPRDVQEAVFLITAQAHGCEHMRRTHVDKALTAGIPLDAIEHVSAGRRDALEGDLGEIAQALFELRELGCIGEERFHALQARWGSAGLAELVLLSGLCTAMAYLLNASVQPGSAPCAHTACSHRT